MLSLQATPTGSDWEVRCWTSASPEFPSELRDIPQPPNELYAIGRSSALSKPRVAIVGTRNCTGYGERAYQGAFPKRNRIIAALAPLTIVVEAGFRSGAINTASQALALNRTVAAVPGPIDSEQSRGSNQLLRDGAQFITTPDDALALLGISLPAQKPPPPLLPESEQKVWDAIAAGFVQTDSL